MRKIVSILLCLALSTVLLLPVQAASSGAFLYNDYDVTEEEVSCYGMQLPAGGTLSVSCGSEKVEDAEFSTIRQEKVPVTVYCLVDAATSVPDSVQQQQRDILQILSSRMGEGDTMVLSTIDNTFREGKPLADKSARETAIETIGRKSWITNLYQGIDKSVDSVSTNTTYHTNRYLVILTDGHDEGKTNVKTEKVLEKIREARIPVYSIVLGSAKAGGSKEEIECLKQFSEESMGGFMCRLSTDNLTASQAAEKVWDSVQDSSVIRIGAASFNKEADTELLVRYDTADTRYEDTILIRAVDLLESAAPVTEPEETVEEETEAEETEGETEQGLRKELIIAAAVGVVVLLAAVVAILLRKPQKRTAPVDIPAPEPISDPPVTDPIPPEPMPGPDPFGETKPVDGACHVFLVAIMHSEVTCDFQLSENAETTLGRDGRAAIVLNSNDRKLSGIHAGFLWDGKHLLVRDKHSTNGTFVNGAPCVGDVWYLVENGATVRAGGHEYRVTYETGNTDAR